MGRRIDGIDDEFAKSLMVKMADLFKSEGLHLLDQGIITAMFAGRVAGYLQHKKTLTDDQALFAIRKWCEIMLTVAGFEHRVETRPFTKEETDDLIRSAMESAHKKPAVMEQLMRELEKDD